MGRPATLLKRILKPDPKLVLTLTPAVIRRMEELQKRSGCKDLAGLLRMALSTLELLVTAEEEKKLIVLRGSDGKEQFIDLSPE